MPARLRLTDYCLAVWLASAPGWAQGLEYRSVAEQGAVMYAAPMPQSKKLFLFSRFTPLEVVLIQSQWAKVRDMTGSMGWLPLGQLSPRRMVQVLARAEVRSAADEASAIVFAAERDVVLELLESPRGPWARVRHRDGRQGFIAISRIWGV